MTEEDQFEILTDLADEILTDLADEVVAERIEQLEKWGRQDHPSFLGETDLRKYASQESYYKQINDARVKADKLCWDTILLEEVFEALAEPDPSLRRAELIQVAAVALAEVESLDRLLADDDFDPEPGEPIAAEGLRLVADDSIPAGSPGIFGDFGALKDAA